MHGIIFFLLQRYADHAFGADGWAHLFEEANLPFKTYSPAESHQDADLLQLVNAAAKIADRPVNEIVESFGEYIAPELLALHPKHVDKKWRTLELLVNTETVLHNVVRHTDPEADPPVLRAQYVDKNEVQLIYASPRKLCSLVKGIVRGVSQHFGKPSTPTKMPACIGAIHFVASALLAPTARKRLLLSIPSSEIRSPSREADRRETRVV